MKRLLLIIGLILVFTLPSTSLDKESTRNELIDKIDQLSQWCDKNNELPAKAVLLILNGALKVNQDTLLMKINMKFAEEQVKLLKSINENKI